MHRGLFRVMRKVILYIVYGEDQAYYDGAKFSFLTFMNWIEADSPIEFLVLTEKPNEFKDYPVKIIKISNQQKEDWSLNGKYHFRIKNRGMAYVMDKLELTDKDKILFFDTDTYFNKSPLGLFDLITNEQALMYLNEGLIYKRKRFSIYVRHLEDKTIEIDNFSYQLTKESSMWGSLMVGLMGNMRPSLEIADSLMLEFFKRVPAHTIEPFALSETLLKKYKVVEGKKLVNLYSTSRKKEYCKKILSKFFKDICDFNIEDKINLAQKIKLKRPIYIVLKQRFLRLLIKK